MRNFKYIGFYRQLTRDPKIYGTDIEETELSKKWKNVAWFRYWTVNNSRWYKARLLGSVIEAHGQKPFAIIAWEDGEVERVTSLKKFESFMKDRFSKEKAKRDAVIHDRQEQVTRNKAKREVERKSFNNHFKVGYV